MNNAFARSRRIRHVCAAAFAAAAATVLTSATACAAELNAGPSNLGSVFSGAKGGDTILLASGSYGTFEGALKGGEVTLRSAPGASVTMRLDFNPASNITIDGVTLTEVEIAAGATKNITVRNSDIPGQTTFRTGELQNANILFDNNVHHDWDKCADCAEGRVWLPDNTNAPSGITISNSEFRGGLSDGIQNGSNGTRILSNTFHHLESGSAEGVHADAIQLYGSRNTLIKGNFFYGLPHGVGQIMAADGADHEIIEDNVFSPLAGGETRPFAIDLLSDDGSIVRHNTFADGECEFNLRCGIVRIGSKTSCGYADECDPGRGTVIEDNIVSEISRGGGPAGVTRIANNLFTNRVSGIAGLRAKPSFVGGAVPTTYIGYALADGSPGKGSASDGLDRGIRIGAGAGTPRPAATTPSLSVRVVSSLRSIRKSGRLRVRIVTPVAGNIVVSGKVRPGNALPRYRRGHSRKVIGLRRVSFGRRAAGARIVTFRLGPAARRRLGRSKSARLTVSVAIDDQVTSKRRSIRR